VFFQKAHDGRNRWWRWLLTITGMLAVFFLAQIPIYALIVQEAARLGISQQAFLSGGLPAGVDRNLFLLLFLLPFVLGFGALWLLINWIHRKSLLSVVTGRARFDWRRVSTGFVFWFALQGLVIFALLPAGSYQFQFDPSAFWPLLAIAVLAIPIQTSLEEVFFRGYLMQGISLLAKNKLVPLILVTAVFAFLHYPNPEFSSNYGIGATEYLLMSALLGLTTVLDDGLELPIGIHAANNVFLTAVLSTTGGTLQTNAPFQTGLDTLAQHFLLLSVLPYLFAFAVLSLMFRWRFSTLLEPTAPLSDPRRPQSFEC
jgi:membrane protease YdiL (CAAX protease family)